MAKHKGKNEAQQGTGAGVAWDKLTPEQKATEFDASHSNPVGYAMKNFKPAKAGDGTKRPAKHKKK